MADALPQQAAKSNKPKPIHSTPTNTILNSKVEVKIKSIVVNVFFDGTKNNLFNTDAYEKSANKKQYDDDLDNYESYTNAYSNVAHLYQARPKRSTDIWIYIDGIGTRRLGKDDRDGFAFGSGETGISTRAHFACHEIGDALVKKIGSNAKPYQITFNVFGFSRGAATARHFISLVKTVPLVFPKITIDKKNILINFVGIFDTVSSYEPGQATKKIKDYLNVIENKINFNNDVKDLNLDFKEGYAKKVFHLCASDEYRIYFSLTDIQSARRLNCGYEVYLPGSHADIGGSYTDGKPNSYPITEDPKLKVWLYTQGTFSPDDLVNGEKHLYGKLYTQQLIRQNLTNAYYKVPLKTMRLMIEKHAKISFDESYFIDKNNGSGQIKQLLAQVPKAVLNGARWSGGPANFSHLYQNLPQFRHKYVHWSARYAMGYHLRRGQTTWGDTTSVVRSETFLDRDLLPFRKIIHG